MNEQELSMSPPRGDDSSLIAARGKRFSVTNDRQA
jgi:hypothetical protein